VRSVKLISIPVEPMAAVRMTQRGKWMDPSANRYLAYKNKIGYQLRKEVNQPTDTAVAVEITFYMPIPKSWNPKRRNEAIGSYHMIKPDIDNLIKGCFDAANGIVWKDDKLVVMCQARKVYSESPGIEMQVHDI